MISSDDPRHGSNAGHRAGCHEPCCREAHNAYRRSVWRKRYVRGVERLLVDATGTQRRIHALQAMGWRLPDIDAALGHRRWTHNLTRQRRIHVDNAAAVAEVYERLCMTLGPSERSRQVAKHKGWAPPLAWDNIDDPDERPTLGTDASWPSDHEVDHSVITRALAGERLDTTLAEKRIIMARWLARGGSERELCHRMGWRSGRYLPSAHLEDLEATG